MKKRLLSALLALVMVCTLLPVAAWAGEVTTGPCGAQGDNVGYKLSSDGYLYIGGSGAMADYDHTNPVREAPWADEYVTSIGINSGVTRIGADSFTFCLTGRVSIPTTVTSIGNGAFNYCMRLKSLAIPNSVTELGEATFANCTQLVNLAIGAGVTRITPQLFMNCRSLENVTLPRRVTAIDREGFSGCTALKAIVILATDFSSIGADAFKDCTSLTDIYFKGSQAQWNRIAIDSSNVALKRAVIHYNYDGTTAPTLATPVMTLSRDTSADKPRISWNSVDGAAQYEIYRSTDNVSFSIIRRTTGLSYTDTTAAAGTTYYYKMRAINGTAISLFCAAQSIKSPAVPGVPTMTLTTDRSGKPVLSWTSVKDASAYEIYRSTTGAAGSYKIVRRTSGLTWTDTSTEMDKTYYYVVRAKNGNLCGKFCAAKSVKCPIILSAPTLTLRVKSSTGKPVLSWGSIPFAAQYEIYRSTTGAAGSYKIIRRTSGLTYTDTTAASGTTYYYVVRAMRGTGSSAIYSSFCKAQSIKSAVVPSTPAMTLRVDSATGKPVISWNKTANAAQYEIYRSDTGATGSFRIIRRTTGLRYTDTTAEAGHTYYYVVRGMQGTSPNVLHSKFCPAQSIQCAAVPSVPTMTLTTDSDTDHVVISWSKAANAAQYEVFRSTDGSNFSIVRRTINLTWTDSNTEAGVIYYYKVRAINGSVKGSFCEMQSIAILGIPTMTLSNDSETGHNVISWSSVACATEYEVYRSVDGEDYQSILRANTLTYTDLDTDYGVTYSYKVRAIYSVSPVMVYGAFCTQNSIRCIALPPVSGLTMSTDDEKGLNVASWESVCGAESYEVYRSTDGETYQRAGSTRELTYIDSGASEYGVTYYYKVRARSGKIVGNFSKPQSIVCAFKIIAGGTLDGYDGQWTLYGNGTLIISGRGERLFWPWIPDIPWYAYRDDINRIKIRDGIESIGQYCFSRCYNLTDITIPKSVECIGTSAFENCTSLASITIPHSVTEIGYGAFEYCSSLTSITIPDSITAIYANTFRHCSNLTSVAIPSSVTEIGDYAFVDCDNLKEVYYAGSEEDWSAVSIDSNNDPLKSATILYNQTEPWR